MSTRPRPADRRRRGALLLVALTMLAARAGANAEPAAPSSRTPFPVKVLVINLFGLEAEPWLKVLEPRLEFRVPGLTPESPAVRCNSAAVCQMTTGMGHANAAASVMAVLYSGRFDLRKTYFLVAGIAGIDPARGTLGSAAWVRYVVDGGIAHAMDARELPEGWRDGEFGVFTDSPDQSPKFEYHSELFQLDEALLQRAVALSQDVVLEDAPDLVAYRRHYPDAPANQPPRVIQCDTLSSDTWWAGEHFGEHARTWTRLLTAGKGVYCTSQQEDNAVLTALVRGAESGFVDLKRVAIVRGGADFDRPYPQQSTLQSLQAQRTLPGSARIAAENVARAGMPLVEAITRHWTEWQDGVPPAASP